MLPTNIKYEIEKTQIDLCWFIFAVLAIVIDIYIFFFEIKQMALFLVIYMIQISGVTRGGARGL